MSLCRGDRLSIFEKWPQILLHGHRRWLDVDHDFQKEGMLFDRSNDTRSTLEPPVASDIILETERLIGRCL